MSAPIVVYLGSSMIDGAPIVCLATVGSSNVKTGAMVQTWIMRADVAPHVAGHAGKDDSVCGQCPRRHSLGGDCYVTIHQAPLSAWKLWDRSGRPSENWADERAILQLQGDARANGLRLGSYGDPAAVPHGVWADLIDALQPRMTVGYTHQWRDLASVRSSWQAYTGGTSDDGVTQVAAREIWYRDHVMASCDTLADARDARALGWRYFLALSEIDTWRGIPERTVQCPATVSERTCATCGACDGAARGVGKASIHLIEHGALSSAKARRASGLRVL